MNLKINSIFQTKYSR